LLQPDHVLDQLLFAQGFKVGPIHHKLESCPIRPCQKEKSPGVSSYFHSGTQSQHAEISIEISDFNQIKTCTNAGEAASISRGPCHTNPVESSAPRSASGTTVPPSLRGFVRRQIRARLPALGQA
jgi:hypothetical protein